MKLKNRVKRLICLAYVFIYATSFPMQIFAEEAVLPESYVGTNDYIPEEEVPLTESEFDELLDETTKEVKGDISEDANEENKDESDDEASSEDKDSKSTNANDGDDSVAQEVNPFCGFEIIH